MSDLPIRRNEENPTIYEEIEAFEDYEFTNCIAYEMAIRTNSFFDYALEGIEYFNNLYLANKEDLKNKTREISFNNEVFNIASEQSYILHLNQYIMNISHILYEIGICKNSINDIFKIKEIEHFEIIKELKKYKELEKIDNTFYGDEVYRDYKKGFSISQLQGDIDSPLNNIINADWKRPRLHYMNGRHAEIELNLSLPKKELIAYIEQIKNEYDKDNSIIKTPLELLGEDPNKTKNKNINKSLIADKFFIYDYVTVRQEQIKEGNELKFQEYEEEVQKIRSNPENEPRERKIQLVELKKEFEENTNTRINELFEDIEDFTPATAKRYYYDIKPFIDDCKYKELITGTTSK